MRAAPPVHAVIRSCGERTADLCQALLARQLPIGSTLSVVADTPFEATLRRCYEDAVAHGTKWTITIDADVLLGPDAVDTLIRRAEAMPDNYLQLEARAFDKVQGRWREVGHRIYRTELLPKALALLPAAGTSIRPESATIKLLGERGHPSRLVDDAVGVHDEDQFRRDLYRKAFTHAHKHRSRAGAIIARSAELRQSDDDYLVILKGVWDGLLEAGTVSLDASAFRERADGALRGLNVAEKGPLDAGESAVAAADARFDAILVKQPPPIAAPVDDPPPRLGPVAKALRGYRYRLRKSGLIAGNVRQMGAALRAIGERLDR